MRKLIDISCSFRTLSSFPLDTIIQVRKASLYSFIECVCGGGGGGAFEEVSRGDVCNKHVKEFHYKQNKTGKRRAICSNMFQMCEVHVTLRAPLSFFKGRRPKLNGGYQNNHRLNEHYSLL